MKKSYLLILIFTLCAFLIGCRSADTTTKVNAPADNSTAVVVNNNIMNRTIERPSTAPTVTTPPQQNTSAPVVKTESTKIPNASRVTMANFEKLKPGMSYAEAAKILGSAGSLSGKFKTQSGSMAMYSWKGKGDNGDWNVTARFDNGKLVNKVQVGLK